MASTGRAAGATIDAMILPAAYFALWATRRMHERGTRPWHFAAIAAKNWNHGALNPLSHRQPDHAITPEKVLASQHGRGAAHRDDGVPRLATARRARSSRAATSRRSCVPGGRSCTSRASALQSETYTPGHTFLGPVVGPATMTRDTARARPMTDAGIGPEDVDLVFVHDAFANEELEYYELLGFCRAGRGREARRAGATSLGGRIPFNTDGGLSRAAIPAGRRGLRRSTRSSLQLRGEAGTRQVEDARTALAHLVGGGSVCCVNLLARASGGSSCRSATRSCATATCTCSSRPISGSATSRPSSATPRRSA